jgi:hypothetical protein
MDFLWIFCCFESASSNYIQKINKEKSHEQNMDKSETGKQITKEIHRLGFWI